MKNLQYKIALASDIGKIKPVNEDKGFYRIEADETGIPLVLCAVADGLGGLAAGDKASQIAIDHLNQWWEDRLRLLSKKEIVSECDSGLSSLTIKLDNNLTKPKFTERISQELDNVFLQINDVLIKEGKQTGKKIGTTLSVIFLHGRDYVIKHIGDSRIYLVKGHAEQLTEDHSWVALQVKNGRMSSQEAKAHISRHVLVQCLGVNDRIMPYVKIGSLHQNDLILLCSDGFYTMVEEEQWLKYFSLLPKKSQDFQATVNMLIDLANQNGGHDNITVVLLANMEYRKQNWIGKLKAWMNI